jgi:tetratricopeptide (TPR) repeat protein
MLIKFLQSVILLVLGFILLAAAGCSENAKKTRALDRAEHYFQSGDYEKARIEFLNVLSLSPRNVRSLTSVGTIYFERGQFMAALPYLGAARQIDSNNIQTTLNLGLCFQAFSDFKRARELALSVVWKDPSNEDAVMLLAESAQTPEEVAEVRKILEKLRSESGDQASFHLASALFLLKERKIPEARQAIVDARALNPKSPLVLMALSNVQWSDGQMAEAENLLAAAAALSPLRSSRQLRLVDVKLHNGAIDEAKRLLQQIIDKAPDQIPALAYQARIAFAERKFSECDRLIQKILALDRGNYDALLLQGRMKLAQKKVLEAIKIFDGMKNRYAGSSELRHLIGAAYLANEEIDKAIVNLTQAVSIDPGNVTAALTLADLYLRKGNSSSAIQILGPILQKQPKSLQALSLLANAYRLQDRWDDVILVYQNWASLFPKDSDPHFLMGLALRHQGKFIEARAAFTKAHDMEPTHVQALTQLIGMDVLDQQFDSAWKRLDADMSLNPNSPDLQFLAAKIHLAQKDSEKAEAALLKALELDPAFEPAYSTLGEIYVTSNRRDAALDRLRTGVARNPKDVVGQMRIAIILEEMKDFSAAAKAYEQILSVDPTFSPALNNLAYLYTERIPNLDRALTLARRAREVSRDSYSAYSADTLGWVLYKKGEYAWALRLIQECSDHMPENIEVKFHLGLASYMNGAEAQARIALSHALQSPVEFSARSEAVSCLKVLEMDMTRPADQLIKELQSVLEHRPEDLVALLRLGSIYEQNGEPEKARATLEKALQVNPKSVAAVVSLAQLYTEKLQNQDKALEMAKLARNLAPDDPQVIEMLGVLAYKARDYPWALTLLQQSNERRPHQPGTLYYLGLFYFNLGKISQAHEILQEALTVTTPFSQRQAAEQLVSFIDLYSNLEETSRAQAAVDAALKNDPNYIPALFLLGVLQERKGQFAEARQAYEKILTRNPRFTPASRNLGILYAEQFGEDKKAEELLNKVREVLPDDSAVANTLGILAYKRAAYSWSAHLLKEAVSAQFKTNAASLYHLGLAQYHLKQVAETRDNLRKALSLNEKDSLATEARRVLAELK